MADPVTTTATNAHMNATATAAAEDPLREETVLHQLERSEKHWKWKAALRAGLCVLTIVAIGCAGWVIAHPTVLDSNPYLYYFEFNDSAVGSLVVCSVSFVWCLTWIALPFVLKPPRSLHPGIAVGLDLVLWLGFIVVALFSLAGVFSVADFGSDPTYLADPNYGNYNNKYSGSYYRAPNNTWIYNITSVTSDGDNSHYNYTTQEWEYDPVDLSNVVRDCTPAFTTCAEQDAFVNRLWHDKAKREAIEIVVDVVEWLGVLLHFTLFVWACVDTHRYNRTKYAGKEKLVADRIIADLEQRGLILVQDGVIKQASLPTQPPMVQQPSAALMAPHFNGFPEGSGPTTQVYGVRYG